MGPLGAVHRRLTQQQKGAAREVWALKKLLRHMRVLAWTGIIVSGGYRPQRVLRIRGLGTSCSASESTLTHLAQLLYETQRPPLFASLFS